MRMQVPHLGYRDGQSLNPALDLRWQLQRVVRFVIDHEGLDGHEANDARAVSEAYSKIIESTGENEWRVEIFGDVDIYEMLHSITEEMI